MKLALVTGTVEATVKDPSLTGAKLLLANLTDGKGISEEDPTVVAIDTCGAGVGDKVLITFNDAARMPQKVAGAVTDATIVAIVDRVTLG